MDSLCPRVCKLSDNTLSNPDIAQVSKDHAKKHSLPGRSPPVSWFQEIDCWFQKLFSVNIQFIAWKDNTMVRKLKGNQNWERNIETRMNGAQMSQATNTEPNIKKESQHEVAGHSLL